MEIYTIYSGVSVVGKTSAHVNTFWYKGRWRAGTPIPPIRYGVQVKVDGFEIESLGFDHEWQARNHVRGMIANMLDQTPPPRIRYRLKHE